MFQTRPSFGDFIGESKKRTAPNDEPKGKKQAISKRRRTIGEVSRESMSRSKGALVATSLHETEREFIQGAVAQLGAFTFQEEVSRTTTHVICGAPRRTMNILRAVCRGCWVISPEWISASLEEGRWLPEEEYECIDMFPSCRSTRLVREERAKNCVNDSGEEGSTTLPILVSCGEIYVSPNLVKPRHQDVTQLIRLCGGRLARSLSEARISISNCYPTKGKPSTETQVVFPNWLLGLF